MGLASEEFRRQAERRTDDKERAWRDANERRAEQRERLDMQEAELATVMTVATLVMEEQRQAFEIRLARLEVATAEALLANEVELAEAQAAFDALMAQAFVLPDGRRVFKTRDGRRVFDETGQPVAADVIRPEAIPDSLPRWETRIEGLERRDALERERRELREYQGKLDKARERLDDGSMTAADLDALDKELQAAAPASVLARMNGDSETRRPEGLERLERGADRPAVSTLLGRAAPAPG